MIGDILPPQVAAAKAFGDRPDTVLFPEEEAVIAKAVDKRRREFTTARACARAALGRSVGLPAGAHRARAARRAAVAGRPSCGGEHHALRRATGPVPSPCAAATSA